MRNSLIHHVTLRQVRNLEEIFATLGPTGWVVPDWLVLMRRTVQKRYYRR